MKFPQTFTTQLSEEQALMFSRILKTYFCWLGTEDECSGADVIDGLSELYDALGQVEIFRECESCHKEMNVEDEWYWSGSNIVCESCSGR